MEKFIELNENDFKQRIPRKKKDSLARNVFMNKYVICCIIIVIISIICHVVLNSKYNKLQEDDSRLLKLQEEKSSYLNSLIGDKSKLEEEIDRLNEDLENITKKIDEMNKEIKDTDDKKASLEKKIKDLQRDLNSLS